jgi:integrase
MTLAIANTTTLEARATAWASKPDDELKREAVTAANARDPDRLWELTEAFIAHRSRGRTDTSPNTLRAYRRGIRDLLERWQHENLLRPSRNAPDLYVMNLMLAGLSAGTIQIKLSSARTLYKALRWAGATELDPFEDVKAPRDDTPAWEKRQPYTPEEVDKLLAKARPVDHVLVLLGAHAGLRVAEMVALRWQDVDDAAKQLRVTRGKGGKPRTVWISAGLARALAQLRSYAHNDRVLGFGSPERARARMRRLAFRALVKYRGIHALRHTCGTRMAREEGLEAAQHHLGHANLATTQVYAKWNQTNLRDAVSTWE